jgi:predicted nucleic acid-binding protein
MAAISPAKKLMTVPVFVDTNIFIYALDQADLRKHQAARTWRAELWKSRRGRTSFQVLQEFFVNVTQKALSSRENARAEVRDLLAWNPLPVNALTLEYGWKIQVHYKLSLWDALIVAAAKQARCGYLLTEDLQADQNIDGVVVVNPFRTAPELLSE